MPMVVHDDASEHGGGGHLSYEEEGARDVAGDKCARRTAPPPLSYDSLLHKGNASQKLRRGRNFSPPLSLSIEISAGCTGREPEEGSSLLKTLCWEKTSGVGGRAEQSAALGDLIFVVYWARNHYFPWVE